MVVSLRKLIAVEGDECEPCSPTSSALLSTEAGSAASGGSVLSDDESVLSNPNIPSKSHSSSQSDTVESLKSAAPEGERPRWLRCLEALDRASQCAEAPLAEVVRVDVQGARYTHNIAVPLSANVCVLTQKALRREGFHFMNPYCGRARLRASCGRLVPPHATVREVRGCGALKLVARSAVGATGCGCTLHKVCKRCMCLETHGPRRVTFAMKED